MRVLTLNNTYPPHYYGGYELTCRDVMERFRAHGHEVAVLTSTVRVPGVGDVHEPSVWRELTAYWDWNRQSARVPRSPLSLAGIERRNLQALDRALDRAQPDVVSAWHIGGLSLSLLRAVEDRGLPLVLTVANDWLIHGVALDGWSRLWRRWPGRPPSAIAGLPVRLPTLRSARANFVSDFTKQRSLREGRWRFPEAPIVRPGVDLDDFPLARSAPGPWSWRLLFVGRIDATKGLETLLRAVAELPAGTCLDVLGGGNQGYQRQMRSLTEQLGLASRVRFGAVPRRELRNHYRAADVVVFPSEWDEPFGLVPLEAMACGVPVVATGTGGSAEFLAHGDNCLLFPAADVEALADRVRRLAAEPDLRARLVEGGHRTASALTTDLYAERLLELHESCASESTRNRQR